MTIHHPKLWLPLGAATIAGGALLLTGLVTMPRHSTAATFPLKILMVTPEPHDVDRELRRVGLHPHALAAAGLDAPATTALANRAVTHLNTASYTSLRQAMAAHGTAKATLKDLRRKFRAGTQGSASQADLDAAIAAEAAARATLEARQSSLYNAAVAGLDPTARARLNAIQAEADLAYPEYFKVVDRTQAQAIALRDALNGVRIDTKLGHDPSAHHQAVIDAALADPTIAAAKAASDTHLDAVIAAWDGVLDPA